MKNCRRSFDERRDLAVPGDREETLSYAVEHFLEIASQAISNKGSFSVALSGGSTPKAIFQQLSDAKHRDRMDWTKALIFWSDERSVPPTDPESNFKMAMDAGLQSLPIPKNRIFRMQAEKDPEHHAQAYEQLIQENVPNQVFDLMMLGMGDDGHTASLFPETHALHTGKRLVVSNFVPQLDTWRMTMTYRLINQSSHIALYVLGSGKSSMVESALKGDWNPDRIPVQRIGTPESKALWILDNAACPPSLL